MGKYFVWLRKGDIRDLSFRKKVKISESCNLYHVYLGDLCIGQVHQGRCRGWDAISYRDHDKGDFHTDPGAFGRIARSEGWLGADPTAEVLGFGRRLDAGFYLANHWKLRPERFDEK